MSYKASEELFKADWQGTVDPYETIPGVSLLGRTPVRHSRDIARSALGIGFETLDRETFDPSWTYKFVGEAGVKWARCQTGWIRCEKEKGVYDFAWLDEVVDGLAAEGVETWLSLSFGNPLYTPNEDFARQLEKAKAEGVVAPGWARGYVGEAPCYHGEEAMAAWLAYVRAIAAHFRGRVKVWEVWNEPEGFFRDHGVPAQVAHGVPKAARDFTAFLKATAAAVRAEIADARIAFDFAATSQGWTFAVAEAGIADAADIFCFHGYLPYPECGFDSSVSQVRALLKRPDGTPIEIWQGESGRATGPAANGTCLPTQYSQARFIARRVVTDISHGASVSSIFTITDFLRYYQDGRDQFYGVLDAKARKPKHGWYTLQCLGWFCEGLVAAPECALMFGPANRKEFTDHLPFAAVKTAAFRRKGVPVFAAWQPQHVELNAQPLRGTLRFVAGETIGTLPNPILVDPVRCRIWDVSAIMNKDNPYQNGIETITPFFALDYPVFLTDRAILNQ